MSDVKNVKNVDATANPAPLGLCGFGMTTILLNLHNAGLFALDSTILTMGVFYGGLAQVIVGIMEWKKNNTFGTLAFTSYGLFWLTLVGIWTLPALGVATVPSATSMACYLGMWGLFTLPLFIGTLRMSRALQVTFGTLTLLFFMLAWSKATGSHEMHTLAGYVGIVCGGAAFYTAMAQVLNEVYKKKVLPLG